MKETPQPSIIIPTTQIIGKDPRLLGFSVVLFAKEMKKQQVLNLTGLSDTVHSIGLLETKKESQVVNSII
jgi:hypothetical protein